MCVFEKKKRKEEKKQVEQSPLRHDARAHRQSQMETARS
jgi:hypothetical protein